MCPTRRRIYISLRAAPKINSLLTNRVLWSLRSAEGAGAAEGADGAEGAEGAEGADGAEVSDGSSTRCTRRVRGRLPGSLPHSGNRSTMVSSVGCNV